MSELAYRLARWLHPDDLFPRGIREHIIGMRGHLSEVTPQTIDEVVALMLPAIAWQASTGHLYLPINAAGTGKLFSRLTGNRMEWKVTVPVDQHILTKRGDIINPGDSKRETLKAYIDLVAGYLFKRAADDMPLNKRYALEQADEQFRSIVWPIFQPESFPDHTLHSIEHTKDKDFGMLDRDSGIDALLKGPHGLVTVSLRMRKTDWTSFTQRDTEIVKRWESIQHGTARAAYHLQAHIENRNLRNYGLISTDVLTRFLIEHGGLTAHPTLPVRRMKNEADGDHDFLVVDFADLRAAGVPFFWYPVDAGSSFPIPE